MSNVIYNEDQMIVNDLGHQVRINGIITDQRNDVWYVLQVGDRYLIHDQTSKVLDSINKRLNEEDKNLRTYRRALSFSQARNVVVVQLYKYFYPNVKVEVGFSPLERSPDWVFDPAHRLDGFRQPLLKLE